MSLRIKILLIIVLVPFICLLVFLGLAVRSFINDKITFVYEWNQLQSLYLASQIHILIDEIENKPQSTLFSVHLDKKLNTVSDIIGVTKKEQVQDIASRYAVMLCTSTRHLSGIEIEGHFVYGYCNTESDGYRLYVFQRDKIQGLFNDHGISDNILVGQEGDIIAGPSEYPIGRELPSILGQGLSDVFSSPQIPQGRLEIVSAKDHQHYLSHFYRVPGEDLLILSLTPQSAPRHAAALFVYQGVLFVIGLLGVTLFAGFLLSSALVKNIFTLRKAMQSFGTGELQVRLPVKSKDEVGQLIVMFNQMADDIMGLLHIREDKIKVDAEMSLAADLQRRFFPPPSLQGSFFEFAGFYEPANQCSGDWWTYIETDTHLIVCIADVTGHGLKSAMLTSAVRALFSEFRIHFPSPAKAMEILNRAIFETSAGTMNMTCNITSIDKTHHLLTYCNASHEPTYFLTPKPGLKKRDIQALIDVHGPRLGESNQSSYHESKMSLQEETVFLFYSDGLKDLNNNAGEAFDEKRILKILTSFDSPTESSQQLLNKIIDTTQTWRGSTLLVDDLSYFILKTSPSLKPDSALETHD